MIQMFCVRDLVDQPVSSLSDISAPVGLHGELMTMALRARRDRVQERVGVHRKAVLGVGLHEHRLRVGELHLLGDRRPARRVRDDLVARVEQRHRDVVQRLLAAGGDDDLGRRVLDAVVGLVVRADAPPQLGGCPAAGVYFVKSASIAACAAALMCCGRLEVGLAGAELDDVDALRAAASRPRRSTFIVGDADTRAMRSASIAIIACLRRLNARADTSRLRSRSRCLAPARRGHQPARPSRRARPLP